VHRDVWFLVVVHLDAVLGGVGRDLPPHGRAAAPVGVEVEDVHAVPVDEASAPARGHLALARRDGDPRAPTDLFHPPVLVVPHDRLLVPPDVVPAGAACELDGLLDGVALVRVDADDEVVPDSLPDGGQPVKVPLDRALPDFHLHAGVPELLVAVDLLAQGLKILVLLVVPTGYGDRESIGVPAPEFVQRHVDGLADRVPDGCVHRGHCVDVEPPVLGLAGHNAVALRPGEHLLPEALRGGQLLALKQRREVLLDHLEDLQPLLPADVTEVSRVDAADDVGVGLEGDDDRLAGRLAVVAPPELRGKRGGDELRVNIYNVHVQDD